MEFCNLRIKNIHNVIFYKPDLKHWTTTNRMDHIAGVQLSGHALHSFRNKQMTLSPGCVFFFNQKDDYKVDVSEFGESFSVHFTTEETIDTESFCISVSHIGGFISDLQKIKSAHETGNELMSISFFYKFCAEIQQICQKRYFPKEQRIFEFKQYIDSHYTEKGCLSRAVANSGLSSRRFTELFRILFDMTPNRYIIFRRIDYAKTLLTSNMFSVSFVAEQCGFSDVYYFSKTFKKETGVVPSKYGEKSFD